MSGDLPYLQRLDGIRGLAITLVFFAHSSFLLSPNGWQGFLKRLSGFGGLGVELFFVLSGFLITRILLGSKDSAHYFSRFYLRRSLRIFPIYYLFLGIVFLGIHRWFPAETGASELSSANPLPYLFYVSNFTQGMGVGDPYLSHLWSLSVEEQFYAVWPFIVRFCAKKWLVAVAVLLCVLSQAFRFQADIIGVPFEIVHRWTPFSLDALMAGALLGIGTWKRDGFYFSKISYGVLGWASASTFVAYVCTSLTWPRVQIPAFTGRVPLLILFVIWILVCINDSQAISSRFFNMRWLRQIGKISYGIYIWHVIVLRLLGDVAHRQIGQLPGWLASCSGPIVAVLLALTSVLVAQLSWVLVEQPFLALKNKLSIPAIQPS